MHKPSEVKRINEIRITLPDGIELAAALHLPSGEGPWPTIVAYDPYHKDDVTGAAFEADTHERFAAHGYAALQVDIRGLGNSSGIPLGVSDAQEGRDGAAVVEWAAAQEWSNGNVGMWGCSYGGYTALKTAAEAPPHLKAIAPVMAGTSFYDDFAYPGGCRNMLGATGIWGSFMIAMNLLPPMHLDPEGEWWGRWRERIESLEPDLVAWDACPERSEYWTSRAVDPSAIKIPAYFIGGWRDLYPAAMVGAFAATSGPRQLLMGPWTHLHPEEASTEPVDHLAELVEWWDRWLKDDETGDDPLPVRFYSQGEERWLESASWPPRGTSDATLWLGSGSVLQVSSPSSVAEFTHEVDPSVGVTAGLWDPLGLDIGGPLEQTPDELRSLTFTSGPLEQSMRIAGAPTVRLNVTLDRGEDLHLVAKVSDIDAEGRSRLVTSGWLNARHRVSAASPSPVEAGVCAEYALALYPTAYLIEEGHRLRLSITGGDFPRIWPTRTNPTFSVWTGPGADSRIVVPVLSDEATSDWQPPRPPPREDSMARFDAEPRWRVERDEVSGEVTVLSGARFAFDTPSQSAHVELDHVGRASVRKDRPDGAIVLGETKIVAATALGSDIEVEASTLATQAGISARGRVRIDGVEVYERNWEGRARSNRDQ